MPQVENSIGKVPLSQRIASKMHDEIAAGVYQTRLPSNKDLAVQHGVSAVTVRAALGILIAKGLVESRQGNGTFLAHPSQEWLRRKHEPFVPTEETDPVRLAREIPLSVGEMWVGLGFYLSTLEAIELEAYRVEPNGQVADRLVLLQGKSSIYNALSPLVGNNPEDEVLKVGIVSIFTKEVVAIAQAGTVGDAVRQLKK